MKRSKLWSAVEAVRGLDCRASRISISLFRCLLAVAFLAEHLTVFFNRFAAFGPGRNVIGFHLGNVKFLVTDSTDTVLFPVDSSLHAVVKLPQIEVLCFARKNVRVYARFSLYFFIIE